MPRPSWRCKPFTKATSGTHGGSGNTVIEPLHRFPIKTSTPPCAARPKPSNRWKWKAALPACRMAANSWPTGLKPRDSWISPDWVKMPPYSRPQLPARHSFNEAGAILPVIASGHITFKRPGPAYSLGINRWLSPATTRVDPATRQVFCAVPRPPDRRGPRVANCETGRSTSAT